MKKIIFTIILVILTITISVPVYAKDEIRMEKRIKRYVNKKYGKKKKTHFIKGGKRQWNKLDKRVKGKKVYVTWEKVIVTKPGEAKSLNWKKGYDFVAVDEKYEKGSVIKVYFLWCTCCHSDDHIVERWDLPIKTVTKETVICWKTTKKKAFLFNPVTNQYYTMKKAKGDSHGDVFEITITEKKGNVYINDADYLGYVDGETMRHNDNELLCFWYKGGYYENGFDYNK